MALIGLASVSFAQLSETETLGLDDALYFGNLSLKDLNFPREGVSGVAKMPLVKLGLNQPIDAISQLMKLHGSGLKGNVTSLLSAGFRDGWQLIPKPNLNENAIVVPATLPPRTGAAVVKLVSALIQSDLMIREALIELSPDELRTLIESLAANGLEQPEIKLSFVRGNPVSVAEMSQLLKKVDLPKIYSAGILVTDAAEVAVAELRSAGEPLVGKQRLVLAGLPVIVAGQGDDLHDEVDARITIDLGGNDIYRGRHGAGVGYSSAVIDLGGDDRVDVPDLSMGSAILGAGYAAFIDGNDQFFSKSIAFGSGLGGVAVFRKTEGRDRYRSSALAQGFGFYGIGLCLDSAGDDLYELELFGQGAGRTSGLGWLVDRSGSDTYRAGGRILNSPLFASAHYSFAQGFGMGFREDSGGIEGGVGLLTDGSGNDIYWSETYGQAASYWFGLGSLYDANGNDSYTAHHYAQGSAMHMTSAYLFDLEGDDAYTLKVGAGQAVGHDYGVGVLLDRAGDDLYASRDARPGSGLANGLGLFVDSAGVDRYTTQVGYGRFDRSAASLGVFVDLGGADVYGVGLGNGIGDFRPEMSLAIDRADPLINTNGANNVVPPTLKVGSRPKPNDAALEVLYKRATQWGVGTAELDTKNALDELVEIGIPALEWMLNKKLASASRLEIRAFAHVVRSLGQDAGIPLGTKSLNATDIELENLLRIAVESRNSDLAAIIPGILENKPALRRRAAVAAGALKAVGAVNALLPMLAISDDPLLVRDAMVALEQIGDKSALGSAMSLLNSEDLVARRSAMRLVAKFSPESRVYAAAKIDETAEIPARIAIEILGMVGDEASLVMIIEALEDPRPGVRISALLALKNRVPESAKGTVNLLKEDPIPAVRMAAMGAGL